MERTFGAKIFPSRKATVALRKRKARVLAHLTIPVGVVRGSYVEQYLTCGKPNCRCRRGHKHGPFHYLVQCLGTGRTRKFLLQAAERKKPARAAIAAHAEFQEKLGE
jgi:hypothetical protein